MSSERSGGVDPPFFKKRGFAGQLLVGILLSVHLVWICLHLVLVAGEEINPWKLGGYGMYTVPSPDARTHVYIFDESGGKWIEIPRRQRGFESFEFDRRNHLHVFRCRAPSEASIVGFLDQNPHLRYRPLTLALSEQLFDRSPVAVRRQIYAKVEIAWAGRTRFAYRGAICGKTFEGAVDYVAAE